MPTDPGSQLDTLWDTCATALLTAWDSYAWLPPAFLLTLLFFAAVALLCWALEDIDFDVGLVEAPVAIFRWSKRTFQVRPAVTPSHSSSPSPPPTSSARE